MLVRRAVLTGARRAELAALRWSDIDKRAGALRIRQSAYRVNGRTELQGTKSDLSRIVPITPVFAEVLDGWRARCDKQAASIDVKVRSDGFILSSHSDNSRPMNPDTITTTVWRERSVFRRSTSTHSGPSPRRRC